MKRQVTALVAGGLFALPAVANNEIDDARLPRLVATTKTVEQVRIELMAAQRAGQVIENAELGTLARNPVRFAGKSRAQVRAEFVAALRSGDFVVNAELGLTARQMYPARYAGTAPATSRVLQASDSNWSTAGNSGGLAGAMPPA